MSEVITTKRWKRDGEEELYCEMNVNTGRCDIRISPDSDLLNITAFEKTILLLQGVVDQLKEYESAGGGSNGRKD
jgi:hypothetical protein